SRASASEVRCESAADFLYYFQRVGPSHLRGSPSWGRASWRYSSRRFPLPAPFLRGRARHRLRYSSSPCKCRIWLLLVVALVRAQLGVTVVALNVAPHVVFSAKLRVRGSDERGGQFVAKHPRETRLVRLAEQLQNRPLRDVHHVHANERHE